MISLAKDLPLLQTGSCIFSDYDEAWIEACLTEAAESAGLKPRYLPDIAKAIISALQDEGELRTMPLELLFEKIKGSLKALGMSELAQALRLQTPAVQIALDSIAKERPFPLFFYAELNEKIKKLRRVGINRYHFSGVVPCCLILGQRRRQCPTTKMREIELESFLHHHQIVHAHYFTCTA